MAIEIAEAVVGALKGELAATAVNAPMVSAEVLIHTRLFIFLVFHCQDPVFYLNFALVF